MVLAGVDDVAVVGEVADGDEVAEAVGEHHPDVVLMDIRMPRVDGVRATELVRARPGAPDVIVLTTFDTDDHVIGALRAGASGFLLEDTPPADIVDAVRRVAAGDPILSAAVTRPADRGSLLTIGPATAPMRLLVVNSTASATASARLPKRSAEGSATPRSPMSCT